VSLADLLDRATNGPRIREVSARLDLADFLDDHGYDVARLLIDMADYVQRDVVASAAIPSRDVLLARFAEIEKRASNDR